MPVLPIEVDLGVVGPMARSAGDLGVALDVVAGPDDQVNAIGYRLALPPPRHDELKSFRVLVLDTHPLVPTASSVRAALERLTEQLNKVGAKIASATPLVPDLAEAARVYTRLLSSVFGAFWPPDLYRQVEERARALPASDNSLAAWRARGTVISHRDWTATDRVRAGLRQQWRELFKEWDVVLCPAMPTPAFSHDHNPDQRARRIDIDGTLYPYLDQVVWPGVATVVGLPATAVPIDKSETGLPIGVQIIGPYLEDRTTLRLAELVEREFGGFVVPPGFKG